MWRPGAVRRGVQKKSFARKPQNGGLRRAAAFSRARSLVVASARQTTVSPELKFVDTDVGTALGTLTAVMEFANISVVPQGTTEGQRLGRKCLVKGISFQGSLTLPAATGTGPTSELVKLSIVLDRQVNKAQFAATDLLETDTIFAFKNLANKDRFRTLWTHTYELQAGGGVATGAAFAFSEDVLSVQAHVRCNIPLEYDNTDTDGAIDTETSNGLTLIAQSQSGSIAVLAGQVRIRFSDV